MTSGEHAGRSTASEESAAGATPLGSDGAELHGSDLARAALQAAKEKSKAKRRTKRSVVGAGGSRRRRRWSGPGADDRDPQPLGRLASRIAADHGWNDRLSGGHVFARWTSLVGGDIAEHTKPVALSDGELTVQAESTAWATQLRLLQRQILQRIADGVGKGVVRKIKVQGPAAPSWRHGPRHVPGRGPRDTYG
ncbi:DciA family protein [Saccharopolyspora sp. NFXS83]|uniref:DUF721 domain-containing protein n=1 Tax=Saccharopolyspora sp. NFXS83 TaxID=2993560 RepID=UPI00224AA40E|nr:DciA family protein [Saccharopolyspora sp. NFXS83]MCX2731278.1 DciA family protein [Saccharopolyspora sp. NFXS83]